MLINHKAAGFPSKGGWKSFFRAAFLEKRGQSGMSVVNLGPIILLKNSEKPFIESDKGFSDYVALFIILFLGQKHFVSGRETKCFKPRNKKFLARKQNFRSQMKPANMP